MGMIDFVSVYKPMWAYIQVLWDWVRLYLRCAYIGDFTVVWQISIGKWTVQQKNQLEIYSLKYATQYEVCFKANFPRERRG